MKINPSWVLSPPITQPAPLHLSNNPIILLLNNNNNHITNNSLPKAMLPININLQAVLFSSTIMSRLHQLHPLSSSRVVQTKVVVLPAIIRWWNEPKRWGGCGVSSVGGIRSVGFVSVGRNIPVASVATHLMQDHVELKL